MAVTLAPDVGLLKPDGATVVRVVAPVLEELGMNCAVWELSPPANTAGAKTEPTDGLELATLTVVVNRPLKLAKANRPDCMHVAGSGCVPQLVVPCASSNGPVSGFT